MGSKYPLNRGSSQWIIQKCSSRNWLFCYSRIFPSLIQTTVSQFLCPWLFKVLSFVCFRHEILNSLVHPQTLRYHMANYRWFPILCHSSHLRWKVFFSPWIQDGQWLFDDITKKWYYTSSSLILLKDYNTYFVSLGSPEMTFWLSYWKDQDSRGDQSSNCPIRVLSMQEASLDPPTTEPLLCRKTHKKWVSWDSPFDIPAELPAGNQHQCQPYEGTILNDQLSQTFQWLQPPCIWLQTSWERLRMNTKLSPVHQQVARP